MKNKIIALILCLFSFVAIFSGCDLVTLNTAKLLSATVAEVKIDNETIVVTREKLLTGYSSYGADLVEEKNMTVEEAVKETLDQLINREIMIYQAKKIVTLSEAQLQKTWKDTYSSLNNNLKEFEGEVKSEEDIVLPENPDEEETTLTVYTPFEKVVELVNNNGTYSLNKIEEDEEVLTVDPNFVSGVNGFVQIKTTETLGNKAMKKYLSQLKTLDKAKNLSIDDVSLWTREVERIHKNTEENLYLTEFEKIYESQFNITLDDVVGKYISLVRQDYLNYKNASTYDSYYSAAKSSINTVYYHPVNEFFKVSHILIKYSDAQKNIVDNAKTRYEAGYISYAEYQAILNNITTAIRATEKDAEGKTTSSTPLASEVLTSLQTALSNATTYEEKTSVFNSFIYKYNQDDGIMNAEKPYVVGLTQSDMVEAFTEESRTLNTANVKGAISGLVTTEYGVHIIMYLGKVENFVTISDISSFNAN
ncbi:MAG: hypothetical protein WCR30_04585, partial [Clostridia bacterium]